MNPQWLALQGFWRLRMLGLLFLVFLAMPPDARSQKTPTGRPTGALEGEAFHAKLVRAIAAGDRRQVAVQFAYPLKVSVIGLEKPVFVKDAASMARMYGLFFGPALRCAIEQSRPPAPDAPPPSHRLLIADGVVSIDNGRLVAARTPAGFKITRMTIALEAQARPAPARQVTFDGPSREKQYAGRLAYDRVDAYVISVKAGDLLRVSIERFVGSALTLSVVQQRNGRALDGASSPLSRVWSARVPEPGDYRIEVRRRVRYCEPDVTYRLSVSLK